MLTRFDVPVSDCPSARSGHPFTFVPFVQGNPYWDQPVAAVDLVTAGAKNLGAMDWARYFA